MQIKHFTAKKIYKNYFIKITKMTKFKKTSQMHQKFDFGMEPKITTLLPTCFYPRGSPSVGTTSSIRLHICAVTYMTEISFHVTENTNKLKLKTRKRRLNWAVYRNNRIKRVAPCRCLDGHVKEPYEMSGVGSPTVGTTSPLIRLHIYVPSHIWLKCKMWR